MNAKASSGEHVSDEVERYIRERVELEVQTAVPAVVAREEDRRFGQLKWLVALVGLVGLGTFGTLSNYLIEKAVDSRLESRTGNISDALDFVRFSSLTLKLDLGTSFSREDRVAIMNYLRRAERNERVRHTPEFNAALVQVMESFAQSGQDSSIEEICQIYERELLSSDTAVEILLHHFGQNIASQAMSQTNAFAMGFFERLESISEGAKVPELAHAYRALYEHGKKPLEVQPDVSAILDRALMNSEEDLARFFREILERTRVSNWQRRPSLSGEVLQQTTRSFFSTYAEQLSSRTGFSKEEFLNVSRVGVGEEDLDDLAVKLATNAKRRKADAFQETHSK